MGRQSPPAEIVTSKGKRLRLAGKVKVNVSAAAPAPATRRAPAKTLAQLSIQELAESLKPRVLMGDYEYVGAEPEYELAERIKSNTFDPRDIEGAGQLPRPSGAPDAERGTVATQTHAARVYGAEDRFRYYDNPSYPQYRTMMQWPYRTIVYAGGCSGIMIGESTVLSAAHCFWDNGWNFRPMNWERVGTSVGYGGDHWCYDITIPGRYTDFDDATYDYAVIELGNPRCAAQNQWYGAFIGQYTGWVGFKTAPNDTDNLHLLLGYPGTLPRGETGYPWPYYGIGTAGRRNDEFLHYQIDTYGGDSGGGLIRSVCQTWCPDQDKVVAVHHGTSSYNYGRALDSGVISFIKNNSRL